ncbi:MAG: GGDEF domain-containing protein [Bacillota bacterium]
MRRKNIEVNRINFISYFLIVSSLLVINSFFHIFSIYIALLIIAAAIASLYLNILHSGWRKTIQVRIMAVVIAVYNPLAMTFIIYLVDYRTMLWLLLYMLVMMRNPHLGFMPTIANGVVTVFCYIFLAVNVYGLKTFEIVFGSLVFFIAAVLSWVLTQKLWTFEQQSMRDGLTGLRNYRSLNMALMHEMRHCLSGGRPISILMIDIDNFKKYNDTMGHIKGDIILREVAKIMGANIRNNDMTFRYGGEEFCVLLPGVGLERAQNIAERMRAQVQEAFKGLRLPVTISIGVATSSGEVTDPKQLLELADKALYRAKILKNRVVVF